MNDPSCFAKLFYSKLIVISYYIFYMTIMIQLGSENKEMIFTCKPQLAASTIAMQKASVSEVLRKMWPWTKTFLTSWCSKAPRRRTLQAVMEKKC